MTSGSWSVGGAAGAFDQAKFYASKSWSGTNGKTEAWSGGIRAKWNNYSMSYKRYIQSNASVPGVDPWGIGAISFGMAMGTARSMVGWSSNDDLRVLEKLAESVRGSSFDLGTNLAEAKESYHTILGNLRSLGAALVAVKHGRYGNALRQLGVTGRRRSKSMRAATRRLNSLDLSGRWLELQYAWRPLVSQSFEAAKALESVTKPRVLRFSANVGAKRTVYDGHGGSTAYQYLVSLSYSKRLRAELYEEVGIGRKLALVDPLQIAWEVVPYSFVVDWFLPIGSYLSVWQVIPSLKGRFMTTERIVRAHGGPPTLVNPSLPLYGRTLKDERAIDVSRVASTSLSVPRPTFNSPPAALSPKRLLNAVSLIHQALRK